MNITHLTSVHPRYDTRIFHKQSVSAVASGYSVTILVNDQYSKELKCGVNIVSTNWVFHSKFKRVLYSIFFFPYKAIKIKSELYILHDPELILCGLLLKLIRKKVIYDIHEDYQLVHFDNKNLFASTLGIIYRVISRFFVRLADGVFVVNTRLELQYAPVAKRLALVPNFPIIDKVKAISKPLEIGNIKMVFAGGITEDWNVSLISDIVSELEDVEFHIAGKSNSYLESILDKRYPNVKYHGHLSHDEVLKLMAQMDIGVAFSSSIQLQGEGSIGNTKVFEYLASGLAVIVNNNEVWREVIQGNNIGFVLKKIEEINLVLDIVKENNRLLREMRVNAQKVITEKYNWNKTFLKVIDIIEDTINAK